MSKPFLCKIGFHDWEVLKIEIDRGSYNSVFYDNGCLKIRICLKCELIDNQIEKEKKRKEETHKILKERYEKATELIKKHNIKLS